MKTLLLKVELLLLIVVLSVSLTHAQKADSLKYHRVLIMPFNPDMYLSDSEQDIISATRKSPNVYRENFRKVLSLKIAAELETIIPCISLVQDSGKQAKEDIMRFYGQSGYVYKNPVGSKAVRPDDPSKKEKKTPDLNNQHSAPTYLTTKGDTKFMDAEIGDSVETSAIAHRYDADLILSINQFEIKTNYNSCIDIANKVYRRELIIHYSLMTPSGKLLVGNYAIAFFPSNTNRDVDIMEKTFPDIAQWIKEQLRGEVLKKSN
ncbi:hypothetical protein BH11BAC2_BH11BAC2_01620 [soil metagenome]